MLENMVHLHLDNQLFPEGGDSRNRTMSSPAASLNTLIYKGILTLITKGFKRFLALDATYRL